jgi:SSS family solute:Na+ symporter
VGPLEVFGIHITDNLMYFGLTALVLNLIVSTLLTLVFRATGVDAGVDETRPGDYHADAGDPDVVEDLDPITTPPST